FMELPGERALYRLAGLDLATGKLPVAGVDLAGRALREEEGAVGALNHRRRDLDGFHYFFFACLPAQSRANWYATRPLREPRCSAHCNASSLFFSFKEEPNDFNHWPTMSRYSSWSNG